MNHEDLNQVEVQALIEYVNAEVQDENNCKYFLKFKCKALLIWQKSLKGICCVEALSLIRKSKFAIQCGLGCFAKLN